VVTYTTKALIPPCGVLEKTQADNSMSPLDFPI
jgi:hypothetical protein